MVYLTNYNLLMDYNERKEEFTTFAPQKNTPLSTIIYIHNCKPYHYEVIESIIVLFQQIIQKKIMNPVFYIKLKKTEASFEDYILSKYNNVSMGKPPHYHYFIEATLSPTILHPIKEDGKHFYIGHEVSPELEKKENVYFLTPLAKQYLSFHYLPFQEVKYQYKTNIPIYIVQGNLEDKRRDFRLLFKILSQRYPYPFYIKLIGRGNIPSILRPFSDKIILKNDLDFQDYHKEFLNGYCLFTLTSKEKNPGYYKNKLTSSINYVKGYNLKCILDKELNDIYQLKNSYVYKRDYGIVNVFYQSLVDFYEN